MSPSTLIDSSINPHYQNSTTSLGLTEQLFTAFGGQSHAEHVDTEEDTVFFDPATDLTFFYLTDYFTDRASGEEKAVGWKQPVTFSYKDCYTQSDSEGLFISMPMFAALR